MGEVIAIGNVGWMSAVLIVFLVFIVVFFLVAAAFIVFALRPQLIGLSKRETRYYAALLLCVFGIMFSFFTPYFFEFTSITIEPNGTWVLRNAWKLPVAKLAPAAARKVDVGLEQITWYGKSYSSYEAARVYVITDKRIYPSRHSTDNEFMRSVAEALKQKNAEYEVPLTTNNHDPFSVYICWRRLHFILIGLFLAVLLSPLVIFRKSSQDPAR